MNCAETDELSSLYLAGELDEARTAAFDAHLHACAACSARIEEQKNLDALLCDGVLAEQIDTSNVDARVLRAIHTSRTLEGTRLPMYRRWGIVAAAAILLALIAGLAAYRYTSGAPVTPMYAAVVRDHQLEVVERARRPWVSDAAVIQMLAAKQGIGADAFASLAPANYRLERAKLCPLSGNVYLHLVYTDGAHELSVFLHQGDIAPLPGKVRGSSDGKVLRAASIGQDYLAGFQTGNLTALIVTDQSAPAALDAARSVARAL